MTEYSRHQVAQETLAPELGRYRLVAELARGGMGNVYLAVAQGPAGFNKLLAVKELKPELRDEESYVQMFLDEARLAARLQHPNVVQTNEVGSEGKRHFMVMEFLDGRPLRRVSRVAKFTIGAHLRVVAEALIGLDYAHDLVDFDGTSLGIVHRDVSPFNVFVTFDGQVKVIDFGIAKTTDSSVHTKTGVLKGRIAYMAPEQAIGGKIDRRADVYSIGVMLWEAAARRRLWQGLEEVQILSRAIRQGAPRLRDVCPDAPEELDAICARAMERLPADRYATARELLEDLEAHLVVREDVPSMREIGALAAEAFAEERATMRSVIEDAVARTRSGPRSGVMPTFEAELARSPNSSDPPVPEASGAIPAHLMFTPPPASDASPSHPSTLPSAGPPGGSASAAPVSSMGPTDEVRRTRRRVAVVASAAVLLLGGVYAVLAATFPRPSPATPQVGAEPSLPEAPVRAAPEAVDLVIRVTPASAKITLDGATVATNPYHARVPKDALTHHVAASAEGYDPKVEDISLGTDVSIDMSLEKHAAPPVHAAAAYVPRATSRPKTDAAPASSTDAAAPSAPPPPQVAADALPAAGHVPLRPIITSNPYGKP
jgi:eukaryotic-like serine/threonine-protein kinase